ncbi:hypothetical protein Poly51_05460 [Rubripirellula tenax]|uniref:DUF1559 domain-containing protein n=1 Tax=Rubripirellula tenax TaxID=2528015 RepID=A0A5C6FFI8_9BACT|nr:H-X9-DG-CTERM domain-containing protein [Rubripirellula tenax]TWU60271.1 hypothetical protein Poly51_05460 [Rubripirellula tenax]
MSLRQSLALLALGIGAMVLLAATPAPISTSLLFGWTDFAQSSASKVQPHAGGIAVALASFLVATTCCHYLVLWLAKECNSRRASDAKIRWSVRASFSVILLCTILFALGIAVTGIVHQLGWLATSPDPIFVGKNQLRGDSDLSTYRPNEIATTTQRNWMYHILPYSHYSQPELDETKAWNAEPNASTFRTVTYESICPSMGNPIWSPDGFGLSHNAGNPEVFESRSPIRFEDFDDLGNTIMVGEVDTALVPWGDPSGLRPLTLGIRDEWQQSASGEVGYGSLHANGMMMLMGDGSTRFVTNTTDPVLLESLSRRGKREAP